MASSTLVIDGEEGEKCTHSALGIVRRGAWPDIECVRIPNQSAKGASPVVAENLDCSLVGVDLQCIGREVKSCCGQTPALPNIFIDVVGSEDNVLPGQ